jgi:hypothetical protein
VVLTSWARTYHIQLGKLHQYRQSRLIDTRKAVYSRIAKIR